MDRNETVGFALPERLVGRELIANLGCGSDTRPDCLNVDIRKLPGVDVVCDLCDLTLPDRFFDRVIMNHAMEHFSVREVPVILDEVRRILKPGGTLEVWTPDFETWMKWGAHPDSGDCWSIWSQQFFGRQEYEGNFHKSAFTERWLPEIMEPHGFRIDRVERVIGRCELYWRSTRLPDRARRILLWRRAGIDPWIDAIEKLLEGMGWRTWVFSHEGCERDADTIRELKGIVRTFRPDAFFAFPAWERGPAERVVRFLRSEGVLCAGWSHDDPYRFDGFDGLTRRVAPLYDLWFTNWDDPPFLKQLRDMRVDAHYLPCSALPRMRRLETARKIYPIGFIGTYYKPRERYLRALSSLDSHFWVQQRGFPDNPAWPPPPKVMARCHQPSTLHGDHAIRVINQTAVNVDIAEQPDGRVRCAKTRLFEITICGGFALAGRCRQTIDNFKEGVEIECYDTPGELREKAMYYAIAREERERIAENGLRRANHDHTLHMRMLVISSAIEERLESRGEEAIKATEGVKIGLLVFDRSGNPNPLCFQDSDSNCEIVLASPRRVKEEDGVRWCETDGVGDARTLNKAVGAFGPNVDYVQFTHDRDTLAVGWREGLRRLIIESSFPDAVMSRMRELDPKAWNRDMSDINDGISLSQLCVKRSLLADIGGFVEASPGEDIKRFLKVIADRGGRVVVNPSWMVIPEFRRNEE